MIIIAKIRLIISLELSTACSMAKVVRRAVTFNFGFKVI